MHLIKNIYQLFTIIIQICVRLLENFVSSMLIFCVPHLCYAPQSIYICTAENIFEYSDYLKLFVILFNCITFSIIISASWSNWCRNYWMTKYLDYNEKISEDNINKYKQNNNYYYIFESLEYWNKRILKINRISLILYVPNSLLSSIIIVKYIFDYKTIIILLFFIISGFKQIYNSYMIAYNSTNNQMAYSNTLQKNMSYNCIDPEFCIGEDYTIPQYNILTKSYNKKVSYNT